MVKFLPGELSAADIIGIAAFNKTIRTGINPFGSDAYTSRYGGKAVPWKMFKKAEGESRVDYLKRLADINSGVASGLKAAIAMGDDHHEKGTCVVQYSDGSLGVMPVRSAQLGMEGKKHNIASIVTHVGSARQAIPMLRAAQMAV
jgi:hypothetical protein